MSREMRTYAERHLESTLREVGDDLNQRRLVREVLQAIMTSKIRRRAWWFMAAVIATGGALLAAILLEGKTEPESATRIAITLHVFVSIAAVMWLAYAPICLQGFRKAFFVALVFLSATPALNLVTYAVTRGAAHARGLLPSPLLGAAEVGSWLANSVSFAFNLVGVVLLTVVTVANLRRS